MGRQGGTHRGSKEKKIARGVGKEINIAGVEGAKEKIDHHLDN